MIITKEEYFDMGFTAEDAELLERCIKRAEFVLNGLTGGKAGAVALGNSTAANLVKQAAAFQTNAILREELAYAAKKSAEAQSEERVSIGDFSYSTGTSERSSDDADSFIKPLDSDKTVARLLRAAGCFYTGTEVLEWT